MENEDQAQKKCFIVTPIGSNNSSIRRAAEGIIDSVLEPTLKDHGFEVEVSHRMNQSGSINKQILSSIINNELVIANLTDLNPNVMYEVAVRHCVRKPIIQICELGTKLPFDIIEERTIFYKNDMYGVVEFRDKFIKMLKVAIDDPEPDNPVYRAYQELSIMQDVQKVDPEKYGILKRMDELENTFYSALNQSNKSVRDINSKIIFKDDEMNIYAKFKILDKGLLRGEELLNFILYHAKIAGSINVKINDNEEGILIVNLRKGYFDNLNDFFKSNRKKLELLSMDIIDKV